MNGDQKLLLVTGFAPFGGQKVNPSQMCAQSLPGELEGVRVVGEVLPVDWERMPEILNGLMASYRPQCVLCLGQAGGRRGISIERVAVNLRDSAAADNAGGRPLGEAVIPGGPDGYLTTLPVNRLLNALHAQGVPGELSYHAGLYLCNCAMYHCLHYAKARSPEMLAGFVHLPYMTGQSDREFTMEPSDLIRGVRALAGELGRVLSGR